MDGQTDRHFPLAWAQFRQPRKVARMGGQHTDAEAPGARGRQRVVGQLSWVSFPGLTSLGSLPWVGSFSQRVRAAGI
jgi:hypothetical protein